MSRITKQELTLAKNDAAYWQRQYNSQAQLATNYCAQRNTAERAVAEANAKIHELQRQINDLRIKHSQELVTVVMDNAKQAADMLHSQSKNFQATLDLRVTEAERDTVGQCFKYLADSVASTKAVSLTEGK